MLIKLCIVSFIIFCFTYFYYYKWQSSDLSTSEKARKNYKKDSESIPPITDYNNTYTRIVVALGLSILCFILFLILSILFW